MVHLGCYSPRPSLDMIKTITQNALAVLIAVAAAYFLYKLALELWCIIYGLI
jgi:hypothetical protein